MKTVIIYRKTSQPFLNRYQVLFQPFIDSHQVAFCFWDENAKDFASALTDLPAQIRGERTWRAIVALPFSDDPEDEWSSTCRQDNPFDFLCNAAQEPEHLESSVPLIQLAQMLGGIPLATPDYQTGMVEDSESQVERMMVRRVDSEELFARRRSEWEKLNDRYSTHCVLPASLYLFVGRVVPEIIIPEDTDLDILRRHESDSSMFWYRNCYPARARFMTQTFHRPGNAYYSEDLFSFWMTALTLAINEYPTGTFEAYRLYDVKAGVSREIFRQVLNNYYNRLDTIRYIADLQIQEYQKDIERIREKDDLPGYRTHIPIVYPYLQDRDLFISSKEIGLANDCPKEELPWWYGAVKTSRSALKRLLSMIRPALDRACTTTRYFSRVNEGEMVELDEYQVEEMEIELGELEAEVLSFTRSSALPVRAFQQRIGKREKEAATRIRKRMSRKMAAAAGSIALVAYFAGFVPDIIRQFVNHSQPWAVIGTSAAGTFIMGMAAIGSLLFFRRGLCSKIGDYNGTMKSILGIIVDSAEHFSQYLSKCCSYMRGRSILQFLERRTKVALSGIRQLIEHTDHLKKYMNLIESWLKDYDLTIQKSEGYAQNIYFDFDIPPEKNREYLLKQEETAEASFDNGGTCISPYSFVTKMHVQRIPVFEDRHE